MFGFCDERKYRFWGAKKRLHMSGIGLGSWYLHGYKSIQQQKSNSERTGWDFFLSKYISWTKSKLIKGIFEQNPFPDTDFDYYFSLFKTHEFNYQFCV